MRPAEGATLVLLEPPKITLILKGDFWYEKL